MPVAVVREELKSRGLAATGPKAVLVARLEEARRRGRGRGRGRGGRGGRGGGGGPSRG